MRDPENEPPPPGRSLSYSYAVKQKNKSKTPSCRFKNERIGVYILLGVIDPFCPLTHLFK